MKKAILTILVCGFMVLGLTGCGGKKKYELSIPKEENIESILFEKNDKTGNERRDIHETKNRAANVQFSACYDTFKSVRRNAGCLFLFFT